MKNAPLHRTTRVLLLLLAILVLSNCAIAPVSTEEAVPRDKGAQEPVASAAAPSSDVYRNKAINYERAGEFLKAIEMWKIVGYLSPADKETIKKIDDLQRQADLAAESHFERGVTYYQKGAAASARGLGHRRCSEAARAGADHLGRLMLRANVPWRRLQNRFAPLMVRQAHHERQWTATQFRSPFDRLRASEGVLQPLPASPGER